MKTKKLWLGFIAVMVISFGVLLYYGGEIYRKAPPLPEKVETENGETVFMSEHIDNSNFRKAKLKELILKLHEGESE